MVVVVGERERERETEGGDVRRSSTKLVEWPVVDKVPARVEVL